MNGPGPRLDCTVKGYALLGIGGNLNQYPLRTLLSTGPRRILDGQRDLVEPALTPGAVDDFDAITLGRLCLRAYDNICLHVVASIELSDEILRGSNIRAGMILAELVCLNVAEDQD